MLYEVLPSQYSSTAVYIVAQSTYMVVCLLCPLEQFFRVVIYSTVFHVFCRESLRLKAIVPHEISFVDEALFNRRRGSNIIGHRAIVNVPGQ